MAWMPVTCWYRLRSLLRLPFARTCKKSRQVARRPDREYSTIPRSPQGVSEAMPRDAGIRTCSADRRARWSYPVPAPATAAASTITIITTIAIITAVASRNLVNSDYASRYGRPYRGSPQPPQMAKNKPRPKRMLGARSNYQLCARGCPDRWRSRSRTVLTMSSSRHQDKNRNPKWLRFCLTGRRLLGMIIAFPI